MPEVIYAIGDIHGRDDLLELLHVRICFDRSERFPAHRAILVHLGDYIDGGRDSRGVIDRLMRGLPGFECISLMGNHEDMLLNCLQSDDRQTWNTWLSNRGEDTLASFGVSYRFGGFEPGPLAEALGAERIDWLNRLRLFHRTDEYLFVHAGIVPGRAIEDQERKDLLWIRDRFLNSAMDHRRMVIHGHTPADAPVVKSNRICVDTGATSNGVLTAVVLQDGDDLAPRFLSVHGAPGRG